MAYLPISLLDKTEKAELNDYIEIVRPNSNSTGYNSYKLPLSSIVDLTDKSAVDEPGEETPASDEQADLYALLKNTFVDVEKTVLHITKKKIFNEISAVNLTAINEVVENGLTACKGANISGDLDVLHNVNCEILNGTALSACWADIAEIYSADYDYLPGTLVKFGGSEEITIADNEVNAVISTKPALTLDSENSSKHPVKIAIAGKVPVLVEGKVNKFDRIALSENTNGVAVKAKQDNIVPIGIALEDKTTDDVSPVLCTTRFLL